MKTAIKGMSLLSAITALFSFFCSCFIHNLEVALVVAAVGVMWLFAAIFVFFGPFKINRDCGRI